jgi:hypothetical protein
MSAPGLDPPGRQLQMAGLALLRLTRQARYGQDPAFLALLQRFLRQGRELGDFIRAKDAAG